MSKFLRTAADIVIEIGAVVAGTILGGPIGAAIGAVIGSVATVEFNHLTAPKPPSGPGSQTTWQANPNAGFPFMIGRSYMEGQIVYRQSYGDHNIYQTLVTVLSAAGCATGIAGIDTLFVDQTATTVSGTTVNVPDLGYMWEDQLLGANPAPRQLLCGPIGPYAWTSNHVLPWLAATMITLQYDTKGDNTMTSVPSCGWVCRGIKAYDPRLDSTYPGGSGPHRWADPSNRTARAAAEATWTYTENPWLHALNFALGYWAVDTTNSSAVYQLVGGVGLPIASLIVDQFVEAANVADANSWKAGGVWWTTDDKWNTLKGICQAGGGEPIHLGAQLGCMVNTPRVSLTTITRDDLLGEASVQATQARRDRINAVVPTCRFEDQQWQQAECDPVVVADYVATDGRQRRKQSTYAFVQCASGQQPTQAAQLARYEIENAREFGPITMGLKLRWMGYRPGDVVTIAVDELGMDDQDVLLLTRSLDPASGKVTMTARSETSAKHAFALGQTSVAPPTPSLAVPDRSAPIVTPGSWAAATETLTGTNGSTSPALLVALQSGYAVPSTVDAVIFEYRVHVAGQADGVGWKSDGIDAPLVAAKEIKGIAAGTVYDAAVSYRCRGRIGPRLILSSVAAGGLSVPRAAHSLVSQTNTYPISSSDTTISIAAFTGTTDDQRTINFPAQTIGSLSQGTSYDVFWSLSGSSYFVGTSPDAVDMASAANLYLGTIETSTSGAFADPPTPPRGWLGGGGGAGWRESSGGNFSEY